MGDLVQYETVTATLRIRRNLRPIKPEAEALDGLRGEFRVLWRMDDGDPYPGEWAMQAVGAISDAFEVSGLTWVASGDLEIDTGKALGAGE